MRRPPFASWKIENANGMSFGPSILPEAPPFFSRRALPPPPNSFRARCCAGLRQSLIFRGSPNLPAPAFPTSWKRCHFQPHRPLRFSDSATSLVASPEHPYSRLSSQRLLATHAQYLSCPCSELTPNTRFGPFSRVSDSLSTFLLLTTPMAPPDQLAVPRAPYPPECLIITLLP